MACRHTVYTVEMIIESLPQMARQIQLTYASNRYFRAFARHYMTISNVHQRAGRK